MASETATVGTGGGRGAMRRNDVVRDTFGGGWNGFVFEGDSGGDAKVGWEDGIVE